MSDSDSRWNYEVTFHSLLEKDVKYMYECMWEGPDLSYRKIVNNYYDFLQI